MCRSTLGKIKSFHDTVISRTLAVFTLLGMDLITYLRIEKKKKQLIVLNCSLKSGCQVQSISTSISISTSPK